MMGEQRRLWERSEAQAQVVRLTDPESWDLTDSLVHAVQGVHHDAFLRAYRNHEVRRTKRKGVGKEDIPGLLNITLPNIVTKPSCFRELL